MFVERMGIFEFKVTLMEDELNEVKDVFNVDDSFVEDILYIVFKYALNVLRNSVKEKE